MNDFELHRGDIGINITLIIHFTNIYKCNVWKG